MPILPAISKPSWFPGWGPYLRWLLPALLLALVSCGEALSTTAALAGLGGQPCPDSEFTCVAIDVPLDHSNPADGRTIPIAFAVLPATGTTTGVLVTAVGGPGASGVDEANWRFPYLDPAIRESFDIVFFDQRGVEMSDELICTAAESQNDDDYDALPTNSERRWGRLIEVTSDYIESCVAEIDNPDVLTNLGTAQAVQDLEKFRQTMGYGKLVLYGESYGTQFAQVYATQYPDSVERLILDGTVDLTSDGLEETTTQINAVENVLQMMFDACDLDPDCSDDMGMAAGQAYRDLEQQLTEEPATVLFPTGKGASEELLLLAEDLGFLAFSSIYSENQRMLFLRALAAYAGRDDLVPLMRLYEMGYGDGISSVIYDAIRCPDASYPGDDVSEDVASITDARATSPAAQRWFYEVALKCTFWPDVDHAQIPPEPFVGEGIPTLVVATEGDPATPYADGLSVFRNLDRGYLLTVRGGSHVMFGWGIPCIDEAVNAFVLQGTPPTTDCDAELIDPYVALLPVSMAGYETSELFWFVGTELSYLPELVGWDRVEEMTVGCGAGGEVTFMATDAGVRFELDDCDLADGLVITGSGEWDYQEGTSSYLDVSIEGKACSYQYLQRWEDWSETLDETCP